MSLEDSFSNIKKGVENIVLPIVISSFLCCSNPVSLPEPTPTNPPNTPAPTVAPEIPENVKPLSDYTSEKIIFFDESEIHFSETTDEINSLSVGDIVVCDLTSKTPNGLLRKITNISSDRETIYTIQASLDEVVKNFIPLALMTIK
jgi:hypothetical protein